MHQVGVEDDEVNSNWTFEVILPASLLGAYAIFLLYPMLNLLRRSCVQPGRRFHMGYFLKFSARKYYFGTLLNNRR